jgi:hypothetical protein
VRLFTPLSLLALATMLATALVGAARAAQRLHPAQSLRSVRTLRSAVDHYRRVTWTYERAALRHRIATSYSYRRSADRDYLQWTLDRWQRNAFVARNVAVSVIRTKVHISLPDAPGLHAALAKRLSYERRLTIRLDRVYPGTTTAARTLASARAASPTPRQALLMWQSRAAAAALAVVTHARRTAVRPTLPHWLLDGLVCIHSYEGAWNSNTGNGYYGGLQFDWGFMQHYGGDFVARWGTADNWPVWAQLEAAARAYRSGRGFYPWPNTARLCGLI